MTGSQNVYFQFWTILKMSLKTLRQEVLWPKIPSTFAIQWQKRQANSFALERLILGRGSLRPLQVPLLAVTVGAITGKRWLEAPASEEVTKGT